MLHIIKEREMNFPGTFRALEVEWELQYNFANMASACQTSVVICNSTKSQHKEHYNLHFVGQEIARSHTADQVSEQLRE